MKLGGVQIINATGFKRLFTTKYKILGKQKYFLKNNLNDYTYGQELDLSSFLSLILRTILSMYLYLMCHLKNTLFWYFQRIHNTFKVNTLSSGWKTQYVIYIYSNYH